MSSRGATAQAGLLRAVCAVACEPVASGYDPDAMTVVPVRRAGHAAAILDLAFALQYGGRG